MIWNDEPWDDRPTEKQEKYAKYLASRMCVSLPTEYTKAAYSSFISHWKPIVKEEDDYLDELIAWQIVYY